MKFLIVLSFLVLGNSMVSTAEANHGKPSYSRSAASRAEYCEEARFQSYINLAASMRDYVTPAEYASLYLPLKVRASKALITLKNYGPLSSTTHNALMNIVSFVSQRQNQFDSLWEVEVFFPVAQDLMEMTQSLERDLK